MESDKFDFDTEIGKLILCTPYHYDDTVSKTCTKTIKQFVENHPSTNVRLFYICKFIKYNFRIYFTCIYKIIRV